MTEPLRKKNTGETGNPGEFGSKVNSDATDVKLTAQTPATVFQMRFEQWNHRDEAEEVGRADFDVRTVLDTWPLEKVQRLVGGHQYDLEDTIYFDAREAGLVTHHDGPFTVEVDDDALGEYIEYRTTNELAEAVTEVIPFGAQAQRQHVGAALQDAYSNIRVPWVLSATSRGAQANVRKSFQEAAEQLRAAISDPRVDGNSIDYSDRDAIQRLTSIAEGVDPRGGTFHDQAAAASASLADYLLRRRADA